jgi:hypothetical protein
MKRCIASGWTDRLGADPARILIIAIETYIHRI